MYHSQIFYNHVVFKYMSAAAEFDISKKVANSGMSLSTLKSTKTVS